MADSRKQPAFFKTTHQEMDNDGDADLMEVTGAVLGSGEGANQLFQNTGKHLNNIQ